MDFPFYAPAAYPVFLRTYSRKDGDRRETWQEVCRRSVDGLVELGGLTSSEESLLFRMQLELKALPSGRWLWVGGTDWIKKPENFSGAYNCTSTNVDDWRAFGLMMDLAMMGCGTGAVLEPTYIGKLPAIRNAITVHMQGAIGLTPVGDRQDETRVTVEGDRVLVQVGDSRQGWVASYQTLLELSSDERFDGAVHVVIDLSDVRPAGERLKGFGGIANPVRLPKLYDRCAVILNKAIGRQLTSVECCLLIDEAAACVVAGNIRRCLPEDSLVHTNHGLVPIKDVNIGDLVQTPLGFRRITNKFNQGVQDVYEIETNGPLPRATLNHRVAVFADAKGEVQWKQVDQLEVGDRLMHSTQILPGTVTALPSDFTADRPEQSRTVKRIAIPTLTADVAWLIGYTHGNGYVALGRNNRGKPYGRVEWSMNHSYGHRALSQRLQAKLDSALARFGLTATHGIVNGENTAKLVCSSIRLAEYFYRHIKQPTQPLTVPTFILQGSVDIRAAYLAGLVDSDGAVNNRPPHLVTTVYPAFARQAAAVLSSLGIAGRVRLVRPKETNWQVKYNVTLPAFKGQYNSLIAPHSVKGELRQGLKMYGFTVPGSLMREVYTYSEMRGMGFQGSRQVDSNYERYIAEADVNLDIPVTVKGIGSYTSIQTYDIEVEEAHCFYCDGYLTHNSAGIRQFAEGDEVAASAKENLWQQGKDGNWRIDPERDVLRMANHTRVFHHKPSLEECTAAVRKQYYSGEGAIQWAGEAERRAQGKGRYGLNPCVTADTWVHTGDGPRQVKDLIGLQHSTYVNGELFSTTPDGFFYSGTKPVFNLSTREGHSLRLTGNHKVLKVTAQTQKAQYTEWVEAETLHPGDRILLHNHRGLQPWHGQGAAAPAPLKGQGSAAVLPELEITSAVEQGSYEVYCDVLQELFDAHGQVQDCPTDGPTIRLVSGSLATLQAVQRMLGRLGILSRIDANPALVIAHDNLAVFADLIGFQDSCKAAALSARLADYSLSQERFTATVAAIAPDGVEAVYDCTVPGPNRFDANGFVAHNCGEIIGQQFHCVAGSTLLITRDGLHPIQSLVGKTVEVWNGRRWSAVVPVMTGRDRQMYRVTFGDGTWLDVTGQHRFFVGDRFSRAYTELTTEELGDRIANHPYALHTEPFKIEYQGGEFIDPTWAYTLGQLVGDGSLCGSSEKPQLRLYGAKSYQTLALAGRTSGQLRYYAEHPETPCLLYNGFHEHFDPQHVRALKRDAHALEDLASWNREGILHFMAGLIDVDGSETPSGAVRLYLSDYERAYRLYLLLLKCGIRSSINLLAKAGSKTNLGVRQKDLWYLQITDCAAIPCQRVDTTNGHAPGKWQVIRSVEPLPGVQDSFCFNEPEFHKGVFGGTLTGQCNLAEIHLNQLDSNNLQEQEAAFTAGALAVATLLNHQFVEPRYRESRLEDPIVGVSFTGLFDFFVNAFGAEWLRWWAEGRPDTVRGLEFKSQEQAYLSRWKEIVHRVVWDYCDRHGIKRPNRCTTVQPAGTKSLLTGASPGWHPPKAQRFIRRITFRKNDPVALACRDYGYSLVPSQSDKDEHGNLLSDPFDPRCTEWLVELPVEVPWANLPGADEVDISKFSALAQFDFYMQVQQHYTAHNTSATIELRESEIEPLATAIYEAIRDDKGYISAALLARFDDLQTFPRLPFEPIDKATYDALQQAVLERRTEPDFYAALARHDGGLIQEAGPAGCDSDKCLLPESR